MGSKRQRQPKQAPKKRNQIVQDHIDREGAGSGYHKVEEETAYSKGWRRRRKHKRNLVEDHYDKNDF